MKISLVLIVCLGFVQGRSLQTKFHKPQNTCSRSSGDPDANCEVDLTIALDFSLAMKNKTNIYQLVNYTMDSVISRFDISKTKVNMAIQAMGTVQLLNSGYFKRFEDVCNFIQLAENSVKIFGNRIAGLTEVFTTYLAYNAIPIFNRPNVKHVLVIITAINDPISIDFAIPISKVVEKKAKVVILGINQTNKDRLQRISNIVEFVDFGKYGSDQSDFIIDETCEKSYDQSTTESPTEKPTTEGPVTENPSTQAPTAVASTEQPVEETTIEGSGTESPTENPTEKPTTEEPVHPSTDIPTENPTEAPTAVASTEQPVEETTIEGSGTESPTEEPVTEGSGTESPTENPTEEPVASTNAPTEIPSEEPVTEGSGTESPTEEPANSSTNIPSENPTEEPITPSPNATTEKSTEIPTEEPMMILLT